MKHIKSLSLIIVISIYTLAACTSNTADQEDREALKQDSIDMTEGKGEGDIGVGDQGGQAL